MPRSTLGHRISILESVEWEVIVCDGGVEGGGGGDGVGGALNAMVVMCMAHAVFQFKKEKLVVGRGG